ncbi:Small nuclear ribonucleoprotein Sm D3 [Mycena venus]|uniref:Small nuclear ribonucleoprotein Sm D3 n=1 Tax=Mycena venus TaxID=2733690 RepID=A0A8H6YPZ8_9AGAR|nr:Small nuclear ribonucleoprotein Sm D3 [Mycena venus]
MANSGLGVPVKLLHESLGHIITVELKTGQLYRGKLAEAEDNLNISLKDITVTGRDGRVSQLDQVTLQCSNGWAQMQCGDEGLVRHVDVPLSCEQMVCHASL